MSSTLGQVQDRALVRSMYEPVSQTLIAPTVKEIPYDYVATFTLKGEWGNRVQDVINISTDGAFVAVSIGYSWIPKPGVVIQSLMPGVVIRSPIHFKYSIIDSGSGRELQNKPIHNIAGLGEPDGNRPFRPFAKPMLFMPRSTIRIEIEEISQGPNYEGAELFIVLHGYKILGYGTGQP